MTQKRQVIFQSGRRGSNPPPIAWKAIALPNELLPLMVQKPFSFYDFFVGTDGFEPPKAYASRFTVCPIWPLWYIPSLLYFQLIVSLKEFAKVDVFFISAKRFAKNYQEIFNNRTPKLNTFKFAPLLSWKIGVTS